MHLISVFLFVNRALAPAKQATLHYLCIKDCTSVPDAKGQISVYG